MNIAEAIGLLVLFSCITVFFMETILADSFVPIKQLDALLLIGIAAILLLVFNFDPRSTIRFDINEHYKALDQMQAGGLQYAFGESEYKNLYITVIYFLFISWTDEYHLLPILPMLIEFLIFRHIYLDSIKQYRTRTVSFKDAGFTLYVWFMCYGFMLAVTGIRCVCAVSLCVLAVYREYIKEKRDIRTILLYISPVFIHSFGLIVVIVRVFALFKRKKTLTALMVGCMLVFTLLINKLYGISGSGYAAYMIRLIIKYWRSKNVLRWFFSVSNSTKTVLLCFYIIFAFFAYVVFVIGKSKEQFNDREMRLFNFASSVACVSCLMTFNYLFVERYMYLMSFAFVMIMPMYHKYRKRTLNNNLINLISGAAMFWMFFFHDLYIFLVNFTGVYFLAL